MSPGYKKVVVGGGFRESEVKKRKGKERGECVKKLKYFSRKKEEVTLKRTKQKAKWK